MQSLLDVLGGMTLSPFLFFIGITITTFSAIYVALIAINILAFIFGMGSLNDFEE